MRKPRDTSKKREQILDAALRVFGDSGYDVASMDAIAEAANVSKRTVYNHYPSKRDLYLSLFGRFVDRVSRAKHIAYDPDAPLYEQLESILRAEMHILEDPLWLGFGFSVYQFFLKDPDTAAQVGTSNSGKEDALRTWLEAAEADGRLEIDDMEIAVSMLWTIHEGVIIYPAILFRGAYSDRVDLQIREIIRMFLSRYAPR